MNTTQNQMLPLPNPLDITKYHTREEIKAHTKKHEQIVNRNQTTARLMKEAEQRKDAPIAPMTPDQYEQEAFDRYAKQQAKEAEAIAAKALAEKEKQEFLASSPEVVNVLENNPHSLAITLNHWLAVRGYKIDTNCIDYFFEGIYALTLIAPEVSKKGRK